jgi:hydroxymethylpyrimidine pyrophosphatase-like HAD family hydrolase
MNIESLEINLLKASEIQEGDVVIVKINEKQKLNLNKEKITEIYNKIIQIINRKIPIYFFPKDLSFHLIKKSISKASEILETTTQNEK